MKRLLASTVLIIMTFSAVVGQNRPQWLKTIPVSNNSTYTFIPITTESGNITFGRQSCLQMLATDRGLVNTVSISQKTVRTDNLYQEYRSNKLMEQFDSKTVSVTVFDGKPIELQAKIIDEFLDRKKGEFSTLYAVALSKNPRFDNISVTSQYGVMGLWRSAIVPGWGQMYKGSFLKGGLIMGGIVGFASGIIVCESVRTDNLTKASQTHSTDAARQYQANTTSAELGRNICIGGIAALYIFNLVDAIVSPGGKRVIVTPVSYGDNSYGVYASISL